MELDALRAEHFEEHVGGDFRLATGNGGELSLTLVQVKALGGAIAGRRTPFSLLWRGPAEPLLAQGIYSITAPGEAESLGAFDLFVVPLGPGAGPDGGEGLLYEAVFA